MTINNKFSTNSENYTKLHYNILSINKYDDVRVNDTMKIIYSYMHSFYQQTNEPVYTSALFISELMGYNNRTTVQDNIKKLIQCGLLTVVSDKKGQSKHFIVNDIDSDKVINGNGEMIKKGTNKDGKRPVKPRTQKPKVKEEIKQNPMPTNEHVETSVPHVEPVSEKPSIRVAESIKADTEPHVDDDDLTVWVSKQENQPLLTEGEGWDDIPEVNLIEFCKGNVTVESAYQYHDLVSDATLKGMEVTGLCKAKHHAFQKKVIKEEEEEPCPF